MRKHQDWMYYDQEDIDELSNDDWEHYKGGGCLCYAHNSSECGCGSWMRMKKQPCPSCKELKQNWQEAEEQRRVAEQREIDAVNKYTELRSKLEGVVEKLRIRERDTWNEAGFLDVAFGEAIDMIKEVLK